MRRLLILLSFALAVVLIIVTVFGPQFGAQANDPDNAETATVQRIDVTVLVSTAGTAAAERTALLSFSTSGTVSEILVEAGDAVIAGQTLARLNTERAALTLASAEQALLISESNYERLSTPPTASQVAAAEAAIAGARAQLAAANNNRAAAPEQQMMSCLNVDSAALNVDDAQRAYDDYVKYGLLLDALFEADPNSPIAEALSAAQKAFDTASAQCRVAEISAQDTGGVAAAEASLAQAEAQMAALTQGPTDSELDIARAQLRQAEIAVEQARQTLKDAEIVAPFDGVVIEQLLKVGQIISPGVTGMVIADLSALHFDVDVDELDVTQLEPEQQVEIRVDALNNERLRGEVLRVAAAGKVVQGVTTYSVRVDLAEAAPPRLRAGMSADVDIIVGTQTGVLAVPTRAIQREEGEEYVLVQVAGEDPLRVTVGTGQVVGDLTVIEGEITENAVVYVEIPQRTLFRFGGAGGR